MTQNVLQISTSSPLKGLDMVVGVNGALASLASLFSGSTAPTASVLGLGSLAGLMWHDTAQNKLYLRNQADDAWILLGSIDETNGVFSPVGSAGTSAVAGGVTASLSMNGQLLVASAVTTLTLPASNTLSTNWMVSVFAKAGGVTIQLANGGDSLNGTSSGSVVLPKGYLAQVVTDAAGTFTVMVLPAAYGLSVQASAAVLDLGTATTRTVSVTGTIAITSFGGSAPAGIIYTLLFSNSLTLIHNAVSLILPGAANIVASAGDTAQFLSLGGGNWQCISYQAAVVKASVAASVPVRQTALSGAADSSGKAVFISSGAGLSPSLLASASPLVLAFAAGFGSVGAIDYVERMTADVAGFFGALPANNLSYLYASRATAGAVGGGSTLAPPQYGPAYNQAAQAKLDLNNSILDDFGNAWTSAGVTFSNASPKYSGTYSAVLTGSASSYIKTVSITSLSSSPNGAFTIHIPFYVASLANMGLMYCVNTSLYGLSLGVTSAGKTCLYASSNGTGWDIASNTNGTGSVTVGWHDLEFTYDPVAGKYYLYLDGVMDQSITSTARICAGTGITIGIGAVAGSSNVYFTGNVQGFEFLPYCRHPAGSTFVPQTALSSFGVPGYASDWFDVTSMVMRTPNAASAVAGNNPAFSASNKLYLGEAIAGLATVNSVVSYVFRGYCDSGLVGTIPGVNTSISLNHNVGSKPVAAPMIYLECITAELGYSPGTRLPWVGGVDTNWHFTQTAPAMDRNTISWTSAAVYTCIIPQKAGGGPTTVTAANWRFGAVVERGW
ncbi:MAG TPA: LamG-like jellyroll fold domain-containing protein [Candidatus Sulfotelmatobacter sp.]|jgi:hypothetical protein|nr:LamG-like jellyroll fold domain-containing protein [Candidatus Sulfotelmatobacter sp.]